MPTGLPPLSPLFPKVTPKSCLKGFPACHRNHSGTHSIDVVSNCSCGQCFRLSCLTMEFHIRQETSHMFPCDKDHTQHCTLVKDHNQAAAQQQKAAAGKQQAGTRGSSGRRNDVKTTYKRRMKRRWNQTLATPDPEWAAPIPAAPAELSSRKINPWAKEKASTQPARHDRSSQWHRWVQTTTMQIP